MVAVAYPQASESVETDKLHTLSYQYGADLRNIRIDFQDTKIGATPSLQILPD